MKSASSSVFFEIPSSPEGLELSDLSLDTIKLSWVNQD